MTVRNFIKSLDSDNSKFCIARFIIIFYASYLQHISHNVQLDGLKNRFLLQ